MRDFCMESWEQDTSPSSLERRSSIFRAQPPISLLLHPTCSVVVSQRFADIPFCRTLQSRYSSARGSFDRPQHVKVPFSGSRFAN